jgi:hypothetical protein
LPSRLGVALGDDDAAEHVAQLAGDLLPGGLALVIAEADLAVGVGRRQEDAPPVLGHAHVVEVRPAIGLDRDRGAQVDVVGLEAGRADVLPP